MLGLAVGKGAALRTGIFMVYVALLVFSRPHNLL